MKYSMKALSLDVMIDGLLLLQSLRFECGSPPSVGKFSSSVYRRRQREERGVHAVEQSSPFLTRFLGGKTGCYPSLEGQNRRR